MRFTRLLLTVLVFALGAAALAVHAQEEEAGHMHGPDGRHIAVPTAGGGSGATQMLSHHDLKIADTLQPGKDGKGVVVVGCDVHSVIYRKGNPRDVVHREHNVFEPENGVYGSHMTYREPGEYVLIQRVTLPDKQEMTLEFPIWVPDPSGATEHPHGPSILTYLLGGVALLTLLGGAFLLGRRSGRHIAATLSILALITMPFAVRTARAQEEEAGHMHGPDGRHIAVPTSGGGGSRPLRAYPTADQGESTVQTKGHYRFELSIENEELKSDPDLVVLTPEAKTAIGLETAEAKELPGAGGMVTTGTVRPNPNHYVTVNARVGGRVLRVGLTPGEDVEAGHIVVVLDSAEVAEAQTAQTRAQAELRQAEAARSRAKALVAEAQAGLERAQVDADNAQRRAENLHKTLTRQKELAASGAFSQGPVEAARSAVAEAEGELRQAQAALTHLETQTRRLEEGVKSGVVARKEADAARSAEAQGRVRVNTAERQREIARTALTREEDILGRGLRNAREVQQAEADVDAATLNARSAQAAVTSQRRVVQATRSGAAEAEAGLARARGAVQSALARLRLLGVKLGEGSQVTIRTPLGGEVETRSANAGEVVAAGQPLATILNTDTLWVESDVFEKDLPRIRLGQRVTIAADAVPGRTFAGTISYIGGEVNAETRAVRVRTVVTNPGDKLKPNMFVRVRIASGAEEEGGVVIVPQEAVQEDGATQIVFLDEGNGTYRRRIVRVGPSIGNRAVIETGLLPGEKVVTRGAYQLLAKWKQG